MEISSKVRLYMAEIDRILNEEKADQEGVTCIETSSVEDIIEVVVKEKENT